MKASIKTQLLKSGYNFFTIILLFISFSLSAQNNKDTLVFKPTFSDLNIYDINGAKVSVSEAKKLAVNNQLAVNYFKKAQMNNLLSLLFGVPGGFLVGYNIGAAAGGGKFNSTLFFTGVGLIGVSVPFELAKVKNLKKAVQVYNDSLTVEKK